ncbi:MAG TPA: DUF2520 domain-containing protein [Bacteroidales bacterium]|nr:DUF2520 domain-containing protein [Bacteroidales bacterium]
MISDVIIAGSGNVAFHLVKAIRNSGIKIRQIFSRNLTTGKELSLIADADFTNNPGHILMNADTYFFAMNDDADKELAQKILIEKDKILVHTAGSLSMNIFKGKTANYGVFYPFQTFSKDVNLDFSSVPICIEASNENTLAELKEFCTRLSSKYYEVNEQQRKVLHLSGVFACNFMNHCVYLGEKILEKEDLDKEMLKPLIRQCFAKLEDYDAYLAQTGPARRNDKVSIEKHLDFLKNNKNLYDIYRLLTVSIKNTYSTDGQ